VQHVPVVTAGRGARGERRPQVLADRGHASDEAFRRHADDRKRLTLNLDRLPEDGWVAAESGLPEGVAEDDVGHPAEPRLFIETEKPPQHGLDAQHIEIVPGDLGGVNALR